MSVPIGFTQKDGETFASGVQIMAKHWQEDTLFEIGHSIEKNFVLE